MGITIALCLVGLGVVGLICIMFIPSKDEVPPIEYAVKHSKTVWGLWFTGDRHYKMVDKYNSVKKILVMRPDSPAFDVSTNNKERSRNEIVRLTLRAIGKGIEIRWYSEPQTNSLTIYDKIKGNEPTSDKAYFITSKLDKDVLPRKDRIPHILKKKQDEDDFDAQIDRFNTLWNNATKPKPEEYEGVND